MSLLVVGSVALDSVQTPAGRWEEVLGGSAAYFSTAAALLSPVRLVAVVGEDFPEQHVTFLAERGVDLRGLQHAPGRTFRWAGRYLHNMIDRETLDTQLNVFEAFRPQIPAAYQDSQFVFLANIDPNLQLEVLEQVANPRFVALDTMNFWITPRTLDPLRRALSRSHLVLLNDEEARLLSGKHNVVAAAAAVRAMGVERVIVKRGDAGALLFDDEGPFWAPAVLVDEVVDPTGAGDCFAAGVMAYLAQTGEIHGGAIRQAMVCGCATASFAVEAPSVDRFRSVTRDELRDRCAALARLVRCETVTL